MAGDLAKQGYEHLAGRQCKIDWTEVGVSGASGVVFGAIALRPSLQPMQQVTSWAPDGETPDLDPDRWVMSGGPTPRNYLFSGGPEFAPFDNSATGTVPSQNLAPPPGWQGFKFLFGQWVIR